MLKHHLVLTIRRLRKNLGWTCIHLGGLTVGIVCVFLIGLLVRYELSFDQFHDKADQIYRLTTDIIRKQDGHVFSGAMARESLALKLPEAFPAQMVVRQPSIAKRVNSIWKAGYTLRRQIFLHFSHFHYYWVIQTPHYKTKIRW
jgi:hypothetical protein